MAIRRVIMPRLLKAFTFTVLRSKLLFNYQFEKDEWFKCLARQ